MSNIELYKGNKTALLFGNTGLTGKYCQQFLATHTAYTKLITFGRKKVEAENEKHIHHIIDFSKLEDYKDLMAGDDLFLSIGTTMAKAGSKEAFYAIDYSLNHDIASYASDNGVKQLILVSAVGANTDSLFFYNRVKGELEKAVKEMPFWAIHIFQPSLLLGERKENRTLESIAQRVAKGADRLIGNLLSAYRPVDAKDLARAMIYKAQSLKSGIFTYSSDEINKIAKQL